VNRVLEEARQAKTIGTSLGAHVTLGASGELGALLSRYREDLPMLLIVSSVRLVSEGDTADLRIEVEKAEGTKCPRCWRIVPRLVPAGNGDVCERCAGALAHTVA
jgi:isoleucyl-tRNA synthetase